jgi:CIC family chloride channel protein
MPPTLQQLRLREHHLFFALTVAVGVLAGLSAVLFSTAIERVTRLFFGLDPSATRLFLVPTVVSLGTGVLLKWVFPDARGSGVPQTKAAFHLHGGVIPARVPLGKFLTGVLSIGSGHSMGREGPSVQIGAGLASVVGRWAGVSPARVRDLVPVGAAGALAAAFNTPVAAVLFALEEVIGDMNASLIGSTVVASIASVVVARSILGNEPLFRVPEYHLQHPAELLAYAALGIVGGAISVLFCRGLLGLRRTFKALPRRTLFLQPALGGLCIGTLLMVVPQVMGVGYEYVDLALNGGLALRAMVLLGLVKIAATLVSYGSGNAGGIFAPTLYIGAMVGGALGTFVHQAAPFPTADPGAYALVGMGALFAGIIRAPMTSVFMIFEITQDYQILVPLMVANLLSLLISRRFQPVPVYHALLQQDQIHLPTAPAPRTRWAAADVMSMDAPFVPAAQSIQAVWDQSRVSGTAVHLIGSMDELRGVVSAENLRKAIDSGRSHETIGTISEPATVHVHPDHPPDVVLERLAQAGGVLPVVRRENGHQVVGIVTLETVARLISQRAAGDSAVPEGDRRHVPRDCL